MDFRHIATIAVAAFMPLPNLAAAPAESKVVIVHKIDALFEKPNGKRLQFSNRIDIFPGKICEVVQQNGQWILINTYYHQGWVTSDNICHVADFRRVESWKGIKQWEYEVGDYGALYHFHSDGSFTVNENVCNAHDDGYHLVKRHGHLYKINNIFWAKVPGEPLLEHRIILRTLSGEFSPQIYFHE